MQRVGLILSLSLLCGAPAIVFAQVPGRAPAAMLRVEGPGPGSGHGAEFLLGHSGDLQLTDAQVLRLAAIARRADARHRALRASMDSMRPMERVRQDSAERARGRIPQNFDGVRRVMEQQREQERLDLRDAISVLTPDQMAQAWEMVSGPGRMPFMGGFPGGPTEFRVRTPGGPPEGGLKRRSDGEM